MDVIEYQYSCILRKRPFVFGENEKEKEDVETSEIKWRDSLAGFSVWPSAQYCIRSGNSWLSFYS